jgi:hypothetical protein
MGADFKLPIPPFRPPLHVAWEKTRGLVRSA